MEDYTDPSFVKKQSPTNIPFDLGGFQSILEQLQESKQKQKKGFTLPTDLDRQTEEV